MFSSTISLFLVKCLFQKRHSWGLTPVSFGQSLLQVTGLILFSVYPLPGVDSLCCARLAPSVSHSTLFGSQARADPLWHADTTATAGLPQHAGTTAHTSPPRLACTAASLPQCEGTVTVAGLFRLACTAVSLPWHAGTTALAGLP